MSARIYGTLILWLSMLLASGQEYRIFFDPSSRITVNGATNVNRFSFRYTERLSIDKPVMVDRKNGRLNLTGGQIDLKVKAFDSGNGVMNKDFRKMLNEPENPFIEVELVALIPTWKMPELWVEGDVEVRIVINEIKKIYKVKCKVEDPGSILIYGKQSLSLTEFGLVAPTRMMGMVKVSDVVDFDFALRFHTDK